MYESQSEREPVTFDYPCGRSMTRVCCSGKYGHARHERDWAGIRRGERGGWSLSRVANARHPTLSLPLIRRRRNMWNKGRTEGLRAR